MVQVTLPRAWLVLERHKQTCLHSNREGTDTPGPGLSLWEDAIYLQQGWGLLKSCTTEESQPCVGDHHQGTSQQKWVCFAEEKSPWKEVTRDTLNHDQGLMALQQEGSGKPHFQVTSAFAMDLAINGDILLILFPWLLASAKASLGDHRSCALWWGHPCRAWRTQLLYSNQVLMGVVIQQEVLLWVWSVISPIWGSGLLCDLIPMTLLLWPHFSDTFKKGFLNCFSLACALPFWGKEGF